MKEVLLLATALVLSGCFGTKLSVQDPYDENVQNDKFSYEIVEEVDVPDKALDILTNRLESRLVELDHLATSDNANMEMEIVFTDYYMRHGAARMLVGVMAGTDSIITKVYLRDIEKNELVSVFTVESQNPTALSSARSLIEEHAEKIANYIAQ